MQTLDLPPGVLPDEAATVRLGGYLARQLAPGDVLAVSGPLGAGKTTLVRGLAEALGIDADAVASPTFALAHTYRGDEATLVHLDLYRLSGSREAEAAGLQELLYDPEAIVVVEWPEQAAALLPRHAVWLQLQVVADGRRVQQVLPPNA
jgi:tRNA threonylcarbamoyladenosine biosynthesis protein TsaE